MVFYILACLARGDEFGRMRAIPESARVGPPPPLRLCPPLAAQRTTLERVHRLGLLSLDSSSTTPPAAVLGRRSPKPAPSLLPFILLESKAADARGIQPLRANRRSSPPRTPLVSSTLHATDDASYCTLPYAFHAPRVGRVPRDWRCRYTQEGPVKPSSQPALRQLHAQFAWTCAQPHVPCGSPPQSHPNTSSDKSSNPTPPFPPYTPCSRTVWSQTLPPCTRVEPPATRAPQTP